jgi:hypothetical protein
LLVVLLVVVEEEVLAEVAQVAHSHRHHLPYQLELFLLQVSVLAVQV